MQHLLLAGALALAVSLGGCAELDNAVDGAVAFIDAPKTQQAISSLESGATALTCAVADASALASEIESGVGAGQSMIGTDGKVYVASAAVCTALGGPRSRGGDPVIAAVLSICLHAYPAQCTVQHFRIAPSACHLPAYPAEVPVGAAWREVVVRVRCRAARSHS